MDDEKLLDICNKANVHSGIIHRTGSLLLMFAITERKLDEFSGDIKYYDKNDSRSANKYRMKETGGMVNGYNQFLRELSIVGLAKILEDLLFDFKDKLNKDIKFWKDCDHYIFYEEMKIIRQLNNSIKHDKGIIIRGSDSGNYLIDKTDFNEHSQIANLPLNIEKLIMQSFIFQMDLFHKLTGKENPYIQIQDDYNRIRNVLIPDYILN